MKRNRPRARMCRSPAAFVVRDVFGIESCVCEFHAGGARWIVRTPFHAWFRARHLGHPRPEDFWCAEQIDEGSLN